MVSWFASAGRHAECRMTKSPEAAGPVASAAVMPARQQGDRSRLDRGRPAPACIQSGQRLAWSNQRRRGRRRSNPRSVTSSTRRYNPSCPSCLCGQTLPLFPPATTLAGDPHADRTRRGSIRHLRPYRASISFHPFPDGSLNEASMAPSRPPARPLARRIRSRPSHRLIRDRSRAGRKSWVMRER
jgi:hypothetical protein